MQVRFHPPEDRQAFAEQVLAVLLEAALPRAAAQLDLSAAPEEGELPP